MNIIKLPVLAVSLLAATTMLLPVAAPSANAAHVTTSVPNPAASILPLADPDDVRIVYVDVNGDGAEDEVRVSPDGTNSFEVAVWLYGGGSDSVDVSSTIVHDWGIEPWYGAAQLDGRGGKDLILITGGGDGFGFKVLSWRGDGLVTMPAPKPTGGTPKTWYMIDNAIYVKYGYRFNTSDGKRYVRVFQLWRDGTRWEGVIIRSVWKSGGWHKLSRTKVEMSNAKAKSFTLICGTTVVAMP